MMDDDLLVVRIDNGDGAKRLCDWSSAERHIRENYVHAESALRQLALGNPIRCPFAIYQHRDFVEGFERKQATS